MSETRVININSKEAAVGPHGNWWFGPDRGRIMPENMVYIGRPGRGMPGPFGNPFVLGAHEPRGATLARYAAWLERTCDTHPDYREAIQGLRGKTLVCFCKPNACHGDEIVKWLERHPQ